MVLPEPPVKSPKRPGGKGGKKKGGKARKRRMAKGGKGGKHNKSKALHCSGSMIGNDRTFVTSAECGAIVNHSWQRSREGTYCNVGGEEIITRHCKEHPKGGIAVCHLDAAVNPETVIVPCYPSSEITKDEMLAAESQSNLNMQMGSKSSAVQRTFLPTHAKLGGEVAVVNGLFSAGFSGAGQNLCNSESGTPIFRDTEDGSRELVGIVTSENSQKCQDKLAFASIIRHNEFIAQYATEFEPEANEFEKYEAPEEECENVGEHVFDENCTPITIKSPGYPELYGNNKKCQWTFAAPLKHLIKVELKDVDIESTAHPRKCLKDALVFSQKGKVPIQVCRSVYANKTIVSTPTKVLDREEASLTFSSDSTVTGRGFEATVSCLPKN